MTILKVYLLKNIMPQINIMLECNTFKRLIILQMLKCKEPVQSFHAFSIRRLIQTI